MVGGFFVASSPFFRQYFHALNYLISGFFSLHLSWSESMNAAVRIVDNRTTALFVKNKAMGYISSYYNVAGQDKANYLPHPPPQRDSLCYSHLFARWWKKDLFYAYPSRNCWWRQPHFISRGAHSSSIYTCLFQTFVYDWFFQQTLLSCLKIIHWAGSN